MCRIARLGSKPSKYCRPCAGRITGLNNRSSRTIACAHCRAEFKPRRASTRYCSRRCSIATRTPPPKGYMNAGSFGNRPAWNRGARGFRAGELRPHTGAAIRAGLLARPGIRVTPEHERQRRLQSYKEWRRAVFQRDNYTCQFCGARSQAGRRVRLNADHILPFSTHPELRTEVSNGRTLCEPCHRATPTFGKQLTGQKAQKVGELVSQ